MSEERTSPDGIKRNPDGTLAKGTAPLTRSGGRRGVSAAFAALGPAAEVVQAAFATGVVCIDLLPRGNPADYDAALVAAKAAAVAGLVEPSLRSENAQRMLDRIHGKAQQAVDVSGNVAVTPLAQALQVIAEQFTAAPKDDGEKPEG